MEKGYDTEPCVRACVRVIGVTWRLIGREATSRLPTCLSAGSTTKGCLIGGRVITGYPKDGQAAFLTSLHCSLSLTYYRYYLTDRLTATCFVPVLYTLLELAKYLTASKLHELPILHEATASLILPTVPTLQ